MLSLASLSPLPHLALIRSRVNNGRMGNFILDNQSRGMGGVTMKVAVNLSRFEGVTMAPPDPILGVSEAFRADNSDVKLNLGVGVGAYRTSTIFFPAPPLLTKPPTLPPPELNLRRWRSISAPHLPQHCYGRDMRIGFLQSKLGLPSASQTRLLCTSMAGREDVYRQLQNLNIHNAFKILFVEPSNKKKFGLDFHLVQFFFACMPSLAVYLVAQYARYEIRRMEAEVELKKKESEEAAKLEEMNTESAKVISSDSNLHQLKGRVEALEVAVKGIVNETQKQQKKTTEEDHADKKPDVPDAEKSGDKLDVQNDKALLPTSHPAQETPTSSAKDGDTKSNSK